MMNLGGDQIDDLWDGLNLGGLLNDLQKENDLLLKNKKAKDPFYKHNKVVESPAYNVLMERYHTRPPQPKMLSKKTLDRLSDPVKGRIYESPPKESKNNNSNNNNNNNNKTSIDFRTKIKPEKIDKDINKSNNKKLPIRYHSPIRQDYNSPDDESILSGGENSPTNNNVNRKDADSFFLTGTMHGEVNQNSGVSSYHPVMDVRIDVENSKKKKEKKYGDDMNDNIDDIYTARTRTYLQEALLRGQSANNGINQSRESRTKKKNGNNEHNFSKEMNAKKIKTIKTKPTLLKKEKSLGNKRSKNDPLLSRPQNIKNQKLSSSNRNSQNNIETSKIEKSTKWASSRDIPLTKPGSRKLLAPVAGIQTKKSSSKNKKLIPSKDNLIGLERVDEEYSQLRSETLLRSNSSSLPTRDLNNKQQLQSQSQLNSNSNSKLRNNNSNLIGSRSAPTLSSRKTNSLYDETSDNETPAYRVHAPVPSRLLSKGGIIKKSQLPSLDKNKKSNITLPPIDSIQSKPSSTSLLPSSTSLLRSNISQGKSNNFNGRPPLPSSSSGITSSSTTTSSINGGISRSNSKPFSSSSTSMTQIDPSDDHMAAVFAAHAKKLTDNLEKASNLSMKYKQLKEYDGIIAANRGDTNLLLPNRNPNSNNVTNNVSNNGNGNENVNNVGDINLDPIVEKKPERYSIII